MLMVETENIEFFISKNIDFGLWGNHEITQTHLPQRLRSTFFEIFSLLQVFFGDPPLENFLKKH